MRLSLELVPRSLDLLEQELASLEVLTQVDTVNIPDLLRFNLRSWDACVLAKRHVNHAIPHIRAIDIDLSKPLPMAGLLEKHELNEVLVITGDAPADLSRTVYNSSSPQVIRKFLQDLPGIKVYAALDPYRQSFVKEIDFALQKLEAGASGLFTQPFFDVRLMAVYADLLPETDIFWGVTSVTSERSLSYWKNRNKAIMPAHFQATLEWSRKHAAEALAFVKKRNHNLYFMPIRTSPLAYLQGVI